MKHKLYLFAALAGAMMGLGSCSDFLDETPDKSGSAYIYHMDQLYGLMGSSDLYLFGDARYAQYGITGTYWNELEPYNDLTEYRPEFYVLGMESGDPISYDRYAYGTDDYKETYTMTFTWTPSWERIYRFNTVLENLDNVVQTTQAIHDQVKGEALFGRAYYHFLLLVEYSLWGDDAPGIGYRDGTGAGEVPERQTVAYTLSRINEDLDEAEEVLRSAGRTTFDFEHNYRPTVPTVQAFRARVALYRGDFETAQTNAEAALAAHSTLVNFQGNPDYELSVLAPINYLDETNTRVARIVNSTICNGLYTRREDVIPEYEELFLPHMSQVAMPISEKYYNLWDHEHDARWLYFYSNYMQLLYASGIALPIVLPGDEVPTQNCVTWETQQWLKPWDGASYMRFTSNGTNLVMLGMTTAEMYLIKAECEARAGHEADAAETLKTLRRTRFTEEAAADNIGGTLQDVIDERCREMGQLWRFFDMKRLNGTDHANLSIVREIMTDPTDLGTVTTLTIGPDDPRWAVPIYAPEAANMGWAQNEGWGL